MSPVWSKELWEQAYLEFAEHVTRIDNVFKLLNANDLLRIFTSIYLYLYIYPATSFAHD